MAKAKFILPLVVALITAIYPVLALSPIDFDVKIVTFVHDYGKYVSRWEIGRAHV